MIFIPSNKPPEKNKTVKYLEAAGIPYVVVNDVNLGYVNFLQSPTFSDRWLQRKRQWIFEYCAKNKIECFWTWDDDLVSVQAPDYTTNKAKKADPADLLRYITKAEKLLMDDAKVGALSFRGNAFWFNGGETFRKFQCTTPAILWKTAALQSVNANYTNVEMEEDVFVILQLFAAGFDFVNDGRALIKFDYTLANSNDDNINEFHEKAPAGTTWFVDGSKMRGQSKRLTTDRSKYLKIASSPDKIKSVGGLLSFME